MSADEFFLVEYPLYLARECDMERVMATLGGQGRILNAFRTAGEEHQQSQQLYLNFRPHNPHSHPIKGHTVNTANNLLLRIRKSTHADGNTDDAPLHSVQYDIVGSVRHTARFRAIGDYQYSLRHNTQNKLIRLMDAMKTMDCSVIDQFEFSADRLKLGLPFTADDSSLAPPPEFSHIAVPLDYSYRQHVYGAQADSSIDGERHHGGEDGGQLLAAKRRRRLHDGQPIVQAVVFSLSPKIFTVPTSSVAPPGSNDARQRLSVLRELFNERPIWQRWSLFHRIAQRDRHQSNHRSTIAAAEDEDAAESLLLLLENIKRDYKPLLAYVAYYFKNGPWRWSWARFGYDPRQQPESRIYQVVENRFTATNSAAAAVTSATTAVTNAATIGKPSMMTLSGQVNHLLAGSNLEQRGSGAAASAASVTLPSKLLAGQRSVEQEMCQHPFEGRLIHGKPLNRQLRSAMALVDIRDSSVQRLARMETGKGAPRRQCHSRDGWFTSSHIAAVRKVLGVIVDEFVENENALLANQPPVHCELADRTEQERRSFEDNLIAELTDETAGDDSEGSDDSQRQQNAQSAATDRRAHERQIERQVDQLMSGYSAMQTSQAASSTLLLSNSMNAITDLDEMDYEIYEYLSASDEDGYDI